MVLLVLAVLWGIVLIPPAVRNRKEARQGRSVENFRRRLEVLAPPPVPRATRPSSAVRPAGSAPPRASLVAEPGPVPTAPRPRPVAAILAGTPRVPGRRPSRVDVLRRRRQVLGVLGLVAICTLAVTLAFPGWRLLLGGAHLLADAALAAYVIGLRRLCRLAQERRVKVRYLPVAVAVPVETPNAGTAAEAPPARSAAL